MQKSRINWLRFGNKNSKFFHTSTIIRRKRNRIEALQNDADQWITDQEQLLGMVKSYYLDLIPNAKGVFFIIKGDFPQLRANHLELLMSDFRDEEVATALKEMSPFKASGTIGFNAVFYQRTWSIMDQAITSFVKQKQQGDKIPVGVVKALLVLSQKLEPKVKSGTQAN